MEKAKQTISTINVELGEMPATANNIIKFLNSKNKQELEELEIEEKTVTILEVKKALTKRNLIRKLEEKCQVLDIGV